MTTKFRQVTMLLLALSLICGISVFASDERPAAITITPMAVSVPPNANPFFSADGRAIESRHGPANAVDHAVRLTSKEDDWSVVSGAMGRKPHTVCCKSVAPTTNRAIAHPIVR